ncbi:hypothetical protein CC80DRAFT_493545 [Byssothecium circinans]|uniref:Uncharacterized protein n=1 Tax=Byssothecium circinans TaxID=147558 RepID=A0A6A5TQS5_9PLEO|nr:hypothetical protein CC80DRAFT_493545 [Byssothecium circinans]
MPPKAATTNATRRKAPFKPPRPVDPPQSSTTTTAKRGPAAAASRSTGAAKPTTSKSRFPPATTIISSDEEEEEDEFDLPSDLDELMEDAPVEEEERPATRAISQMNPPIPAPLLARLLHENFEDKNTQIQKGAMDLFGNYVGIFVREAIARAQEERSKAAKRGERSGGFLQVEDLEKLAPQLVLDF